MPDRVAADGGQVEVGDRAQERVGDLRDDACAVAGAGVGADGTAVLEVAQGVQGGLDDVVARRAARASRPCARPHASRSLRGS